MTNNEAKLHKRATSLFESHEKLMQDLISLRIKQDLSQEIVGERMGVSQPAVAAFERDDSNPTLSTIRRYALAVGAIINIQVLDDNKVQHAKNKPLKLSSLNKISKRSAKITAK